MASSPRGVNIKEEEEEDDYLNMKFEDTERVQETSLQRTQRLKRESRARGHHKPRQQRAKEDREKRDKALATSLLEDPRAQNSKGLAMMKQMGFSGGGLGKSDAQGQTEPLEIKVKDNRGGIGHEPVKKRRHDGKAQNPDEVKAPRHDHDEFRQYNRKYHMEGRLSGITHSAQRLAERFDDKVQLQADGTFSRPPLKELPVEYRDRIRRRDLKQRDAEFRRQMEGSLPVKRMASYDDDDDDDYDDRFAMGRDGGLQMADELDEEDEELDEFLNLSVYDRFYRVTDYLRYKHRYCFWCKMTYPDEQMEGCPGRLEKDHD
ncbi:hypothetical protein CDD80_3956 [Ophiocordyceps camponoti-rufipedis]|uniref:G-patch domain-containing protein n=1 Tax=Ophiocordyceps camponoti-rufipedis TaxID=2004952 RepID=A0A2C5ZIL7_9HYPO|nr:hypothetical protein CDD80_3956 [Ophiocordyceps camponoti-rufipedis]